MQLYRQFERATDAFKDPEGSQKQLKHGDLERTIESVIMSAQGTNLTFEIHCLCGEKQKNIIHVISDQIERSATTLTTIMRLPDCGRCRRKMLVIPVFIGVLGSIPLKF